MRKTLLVILALVLASAVEASDRPAPRTEQELIAHLKAMPDEAFRPAFVTAFRARDCVVDARVGDPSAFIAELAQEIAKLVGYEADLSPAAVRKIDDLSNNMGKIMVDAGDIQIDDGIITLTDCP